MNDENKNLIIGKPPNEIVFRPQTLDRWVAGQLDGTVLKVVVTDGVVWLQNSLSNEIYMVGPATRISDVSGG